MMRSVAWGALLGALAFFPVLASAAGISVSPIRMQFDPAQRSGSVTVSNESDDTKVIQVSVVSWSQDKGQPVYQPTRDLIATPALFRIPAKSRQLVRVGFPGNPPDDSVEHAYRIYVEEVPEGKNNEIGVRFLLRLGIPLFTPPAKPHESLDWQLHSSGGKLVLTVENKGNEHLRLDAVQLAGSDGIVVATHNELTYLLAGNRIEIKLDTDHVPAANTQLRLLAETSRGPLETPLTVVSP